MLRSISRETRFLIAISFIFVALARGIWHFVNQPGQVAVTSPDGRYEVAMVAPSIWQHWRGDFDVPTTLTLTDTKNSSEIEINREPSLTIGFVEREGQPETVWWRKDSRAILFITCDESHRYKGAAYEIQANPLAVKKAPWAQWSEKSLTFYWPFALVKDKHKTGTGKEKIILQQFANDWAKTKALSLKHPEIMPKHTFTVY